VEGGLQEARFLAKVTMISSSKKGTVVYEDGTVYDGARDRGRQHGRGILTLANGNGTYEGDFIEGRRGGYGTLSANLSEGGLLKSGVLEPPNMVYRGEWKNDLRHGYGI
jgi:hypothetical protein